MEKYIYNYLDGNYYIKLSDVGNYGIYMINDARRFVIPIYGEKLTQEIVTIFAVDEETAIYHINNWATFVEPSVDLEFYWKTNHDIFFGNIGNLVMNVGARTIGNSIIQVQPMTTPTASLMFMDYVYETKTEKIINKVKSFFKNIYYRILGIFKN